MDFFFFKKSFFSLRNMCCLFLKMSTPCSEILCDVFENTRRQYWIPIGPLGEIVTFGLLPLQTTTGKQKSCSEEGDQQLDCRVCRNMPDALQTSSTSRECVCVFTKSLKRKINPITNHQQKKPNLFHLKTNTY